MEEKKQESFRTSIGGQALIEGILMRGPKKDAIVVRAPEGLVTKVTDRKFVKDKCPILGWPIIRGAATFLSAMVTGVKALMFSADYFPEEEGAQPDKLDQWLAKHVSADKLQNVLVAVALVISLGLTLLLFLFLPTFLAGLIDPFINSALVHNLVDRLVKLDGEKEHYMAYGDTLMNHGVYLKQAYSGTGYNENVRYYPDFASRLYFMSAEQRAKARRAGKSFDSAE